MMQYTYLPRLPPPPPAAGPVLPAYVIFSVARRSAGRPIRVAGAPPLGCAVAWADRAGPLFVVFIVLFRDACGAGAAPCGGAVFRALVGCFRILAAPARLPG